jgi:hypothetical protein
MKAKRELQKMQSKKSDFSKPYKKGQRCGLLKKLKQRRSHDKAGKN